MLNDSTKGFTVWLTGLPCAGKSTIARRLSRRLLELGRLVEVLDGDLVRQNLSKGLGFARADRDTNIRRIGFVAKLLTRNGVATIVSAISPYRAVREDVRRDIGQFIEVFVNCPLDVCEERDVKGMYAKARAGQLTAFTGVDDPYEPPERAEVVVHTESETVEESVNKIIRALAESGYLNADAKGDLESNPALIVRLKELLTADRD
jgi:adenylylsulfate kinase